MSRSLRALLGAAALSGAVCCLSAGLAQDAGPAPPPEIACLVAMTGLWDTETVLTGFPATTGFAKLIMLGDRWLVEEFKSGAGDEIVEARAITGWDPDKQRYVRAWINTADTKINLVELTWYEAQQALVADPQLFDLGSGPTSVRATTHMPDSDTIVFTVTPVAPDSLPGMTITYTRIR